MTTYNIEDCVIILQRTEDESLLKSLAPRQLSKKPSFTDISKSVLKWLQSLLPRVCVCAHTYTFGCSKLKNYTNSVLIIDKIDFYLAKTPP